MLLVTKISIFSQKAKNKSPKALLSIIKYLTI